MRKHVVYILDLSMILTFDLYVGGMGRVSLVSLLTVFIMLTLTYVNVRLSTCFYLSVRFSIDLDLYQSLKNLYT